MIYRSHVLVCGGTGCTASKSVEIMNQFEKLIHDNQIESEVKVVKTGCFGLCEKGPIVVVYPEGATYCHVSPDDVKEIVEEHLVKGRIVKRLLLGDKEAEDVSKALDDVGFFKRQVRVALRNCGVINPENIDEYIARDGYRALGKVLTEMTPQQVIDTVKKSGLRGRGGAGFPTGLKWEFASKSQADQKYVCCNADEGDPGAFMDRSILEGDPHSVLEAMAIAGYAIGSNKGYMYIRGEYTLSIERMQLAIEQARKRGFLGENILGTEFSFDIEIRQGAGSYVCGEETALIASIEGKRGEPFYKPPYPTDAGLWGKPTLINNVETLANIPPIIMHGGRWFREIGTAKSPGTKVFTLTGNVANKGLIEVPMGITLREVVYEIGGGIPGGHKFKMAQTGGTSGGCIPAEQLDLSMDYDTLAEAGTALGSGALLIIDDTHCIVDIVKCFMQFFKNESCGKCTPCREGTYQMYHILDRISKGKGNPKDIDNMMVLSRTMMRSSLCGLGQAAPNPVVTTLYFYRDEYNAHIRDKVCPAGVCPIKNTEGTVLPASHSVRTIPIRDK